MTSLPVHVDRTVFIRARRETVFTFFTESDRFAAWWGEGSTIDARPGGAFVMRLPGGGEASGEVGPDPDFLRLKGGHFDGWSSGCCRCSVVFSVGATDIVGSGGSE